MIGIDLSSQKVIVVPLADLPQSRGEPINELLRRENLTATMCVETQIVMKLIGPGEGSEAFEEHATG